MSYVSFSAFYCDMAVLCFSSDLERTVVIISVKSAKELKLNASKESTLFMGKFILLELVLCSIIEIKPANV